MRGSEGVNKKTTMVWKYVLARMAGTMAALRALPRADSTVDVRVDTWGGKRVGVRAA